MKVIVLYRFKSEQARPVLDLEHEYEQRTGRKLEHVNTDSISGDSMAKLYGVINYPAILAVTTDGQLLHLWQGEMLPLVNEIMAYDQNS